MTEIRSFGTDKDGVLLAHGTHEPIEGAFETLADVVRLRGAENVWVVSRCAPGSRRRSLEQLEAYDFFVRTGVLLDHVIFVDAPEDKVRVCRELGIRDFVDDSPQVVASMCGDVDGRFLFRSSKTNVRSNLHLLHGVIIVDKWEQVAPYVVTAD